MPKPIRPLLDEPLEDAFDRVGRYVKSKPDTTGYITMIVMGRQANHSPMMELEMASEGLRGMPDEMCARLLRETAGFFIELAESVERGEGEES